MSNILQRDGLTIELLQRLSYKSALGISLKKNLHYFDRDALFMELIKVNEWYDEYAELHELALDYRIKSIQSAIMKYNRYYPDHQARKVFDDLFVTISRPSAYGEYEPYRFVDTKEAFAEAVGQI